MTESLRAWRTRIAILGGVLLTVLASLLLAQTDLMQRSDAMPARRLPLIDVAATIGASEWSLVQLNTPTPQPTAVVMDDETASEMVAAVSSCGRAPQDWQTIIVQPNEDLTVIAARVNAGVRELADANCLYLYQVLPGMTLFVPPDKSPEEAATAVAVACGPPAWWIPVPVAAGSTLASLARQYATSVAAIMQANCLETTTISAGRSLYLPPLPTRQIFPTATTPPTATATTPPTATSLPSPTPTTVVQPTQAPTAIPTLRPTATAELPPTITPTPIVSATPAPLPTAEPSVTPTINPTLIPPSPTPGPSPTPQPTATPMPLPSATPTAIPTAVPTSIPTAAPTAEPTAAPTAEPTATVELPPTAEPTPEPTAEPTAAPTAEATAEPTAEPTPPPTATPELPNFRRKW